MIGYITKAKPNYHQIKETSHSKTVDLKFQDFKRPTIFDYLKLSLSKYYSPMIGGGY